MESLEKRSARRARKRNLQQAILAAVSAAGIIAVAAVAPNLPYALKKLGMLPRGSSDTGSINRARNRLLKKGLLVRSADGFLCISPSGQRTLQLAQASKTAHTHRRWDGRWRVLIFDIPERRRAQRDKMRTILSHIGFIMLQNSVWAHPYDCEDVVALLKAELKIGTQLLYLIVDEIEGDIRLRKHFRLR